ncbi:hypothetical protein HYH03_018808 [Edaphochlamys debaryana]|uniref:Uncharacterized protein n=1 Tax=Edaphochlamys debaryana TaxID=47281 RepID=A0A835XFB5_9CHLO|nr:hypothetical protein HYH03_018808 [Edaphochlamys debaryana]|eukprot:KAG2482265.1 hypothetical protein HYH03_018808 [Edaphochlamys debaryana]
MYSSYEKATRVSGHAVDAAAKWLDWPTYLAYVRELRAEAAGLRHDGRPRTPADVAMSLQAYLIAAILACVPDRQRTLRELEVGRTLVKDAHGVWSIRHTHADYKTGGTYGERPPLVIERGLYYELEEFIGTWRQHLNPQHSLLFTKRDGSGPLSVGELSRSFSLNAFRLTGKKVNPHMVRDMIVTYARSGHASEHELEALAVYMGHSLAEQRGTYDRRTKAQKVQPAMGLLAKISGGSVVGGGGGGAVRAAAAAAPAGARTPSALAPAGSQGGTGARGGGGVGGGGGGKAAGGGGKTGDGGSGAAGTAGRAKRVRAAPAAAAAAAAPGEAAAKPGPKRRSAARTAAPASALTAPEAAEARIGSGSETSSIMPDVGVDREAGAAASATAGGEGAAKHRPRRGPDRSKAGPPAGPDPGAEAGADGTGGDGTVESAPGPGGATQAQARPRARRSRAGPEAASAGAGGAAEAGAQAGAQPQAGGSPGGGGLAALGSASGEASMAPATAPLERAESSGGVGTAPQGGGEAAPGVRSVRGRARSGSARG